MTKRFLASSGILLILAMLFMLAGCEENKYPDSLYNPNATFNASAEITAVDPPNLGLAGVTVITLTGKNFSPVLNENIVFFDAVKGTLLEGSETRLVVRAPIYTSDSCGIRVSVQGALLFSNKWKYKLEPAQTPLAAFTTAEQPWAITADAAGNVYTSLVVSNAGVGIKKITPEGVMGDYSPKGGETKYSAMKMGPGGVIYAVRIAKAIFTIPAAGEKPVTWVTAGLGTIYDLDFDANKNIWGVGNNTDIYRVKQDKSVAKFPFTADLRSVRVFNGHVYVAGKKDGAEKIWRFPLNGEELGAVEEYFDFSAKVSSEYSVYCITFSADGYMYVGTNAPQALYLVHPGGNFEVLYPGQFLPKALVFAWGAGTTLCYTREATAANPQTIIRLNTLKQSAPYYGIL